MADRAPFEDARLQDYLDNRLAADERARVVSELAHNPALAARFEQMRRDHEMLQAMGQELLDEPVPERLRVVLQEGTTTPPRANGAPSADHAAAQANGRTGVRQWLAKAAAVVLLLAVGAGGGWIANDLANPAPSAQDLILASASQAFSFYSEGDGYPLDFPADRADAFRDWISQAFERDIEPPDLQEIGYSFEGGRLMPGGGVRVGAFQFSAPERGRLGVFFWPEEKATAEPLIGSAPPDVAYRMWSGNGFAIAVMGNEKNTDLDSVAEAVFGFYQDVFDASS